MAKKLKQKVEGFNTMKVVEMSNRARTSGFISVKGWIVRVTRANEKSVWKVPEDQKILLTYPRLRDVLRGHSWGTGGPAPAKKTTPELAKMDPNWVQKFNSEKKELAPSTRKPSTLKSRTSSGRPRGC